MDLFFDSEFSVEHPVLNADESHHCIRVKRHREGEKLGITDGNGNIYQATLHHFDGKCCHFEDISIFFTPKEAKPEIHLVVAILKNADRYEWMVEKATELGVTHFHPIITKRCERSKLNTDRLLKKAISAVKQSHNPYLPYIHKPISFKEFITSTTPLPSSIFIAHFEDSISIQSIPKLKEYWILIGPEGGFDDQEIINCQKKNITNISLGTTVLRTETAAITAAALIING